MDTRLRIGIKPRVMIRVEVDIVERKVGSRVEAEVRNATAVVAAVVVAVRWLAVIAIGLQVVGR